MSTIQHIHFDTIDSTHSWAKKNAVTLDRHEMTCITADAQTAGHGRWQRKWISPPKQNIYATLFFCIPSHQPYIANLAQVLALSCASLLEQEGLSPQLKWPNDVLVDRKKIAGVLCETVMLQDAVGIVLSIGLNVNMTPEQLASIDQPAHSFAEASGKNYDLAIVLELLLNKFVKDLALLQAQGFAAFHKRYETLLAFKGEKITSFDGIHKREGICQGITLDGHLQLLLPSGETQLLSAGELYPT